MIGERERERTLENGREQDTGSYSMIRFSWNMGKQEGQEGTIASRAVTQKERKNVAKFQFRTLTFA